MLIYVVKSKLHPTRLLGFSSVSQPCQRLPSKSRIFYLPAARLEDERQLAHGPRVGSLGGHHAQLARHLCRHPWPAIHQPCAPAHRLLQGDQEARAHKLCMVASPERAQDVVSKSLPGAHGELLAA